MSERKLFTSESVSEGHPDKIADQISDAILDEILTQDPDAHVAAETVVYTGSVHVFGEISTSAYVDINRVVRDTIAEIGIETQIKWVNDIYLNDKKIAGILTEAITSVETGLITDVIIGAGLNFHLTDLPEELSSIATSLFRHQPTITRNQLISEIWKLFFQIPVQDHLKVYKEKSLVLNKQVTYSKNNQIIHGRAIDITDQGYLIVEKTDKTLETLHSGEISLSSWTL